MIQGADDGWGSATVIGGFVVAVVFLALFVVIERRVDRPLIRLDLFSNRMFAVSAVVTVIGMFAYLGTAYATSIRLSAIQDYSPLKTSIGFFCLNVMGVVLFPVSTRMIERYNPGWVLAAGMAMIGVGDLVLAAIPATNLSIARRRRAAARRRRRLQAGGHVDHRGRREQRADVEGRHGQRRDEHAARRRPDARAGHRRRDRADQRRERDQRQDRLDPGAEVGADGVLRRAGARAGRRSARRSQAAVAAVKSGPLGQNGVPAQVPGPDGKLIPFNPLKDVAFHALSHGYALGYLVCGIAALVAAPHRRRRCSAATSTTTRSSNPRPSPPTEPAGCARHGTGTLRPVRGSKSNHV